MRAWLAALLLVPCIGAAAEAASGFVYRVSAPGDNQGAVLYLYGTVHVGSSNSSGLDDATRELLGHSTRLALELDPRNSTAIAKAMQTYALYPVGESLRAHLPEALMDRAAQRADQLKLPEVRIEQLRPWIVANLLTVLTLANSGLDPRRGSESLLAAEAVKANVPVVEIEGADAQFKILGGAPEATQVDALRRTLDGLDDGRIAGEAKRLVDAWTTHDGATITTMLTELNEEPGLFPQFMATDLIAARDAVMTEAALADLKAGGQTFFAVGALHLFGEKGLINQLKKSGYSVDPVN